MYEFPVIVDFRKPESGICTTHILYIIYMTKRRKRNGGGFSTLTSCISTTMVLILLGTVVFFVTVGHNFSRSLRENFTVEVLLDDSIGNRDLVQLQKELRTKPYVRNVHYISKERGTREMAKALESGPDEFLGYSPIPAEFELFLKAEYANLDSLKLYEPDLRRHKGVTDIIYPKDAMNFVNYIIPLTGTVMLTVALLLTFVSFSLINNTIRMSVYARRFTIHTMKLVGAKWNFIRRPFMIRAFWIGFTAALIADGLIAGGIYALLQLDVYVSTLITPAVMGITLGSVVVCGLFLTLLCAFFSVNRHLRMSASDVYLK